MISIDHLIKQKESGITTLISVVGMPTTNKNAMQIICFETKTGMFYIFTDILRLGASSCCGLILSVWFSYPNYLI